MNGPMQSLIGMPLSHIWRGYGSALFFEFGKLTATQKRDGSSGPPEGEMGLMIEWSWRIEGRRSILCGSWSDEKRWDRVFKFLVGCDVTQVALFGRLPEIDVTLSSGAHVLSFMTNKGFPAWTLFDRRNERSSWLRPHRGVLTIGNEQ